MSATAGVGQPTGLRQPIARVLIDSPLPQLDRLFDYGIPEALREQAVAGVRVRVPLRSAGRVADGFIVEIAPPGDYTGALSEIEEIVSSVPVLTPEVWALARAVSHRAAGNANDIVRLAVPNRQVRVEKAYLAAALGETSPAPEVAAAAESGAAVTNPASTPSVSAARPAPEPQAGDARPGLEPLEPLEPPTRVHGYGDGVVETAIAARGRLAIDAIPLVSEVSPGVWVGEWAVTMAAAAAATLAGGATAILAVPDYRDQEQLAAALAAILPAQRVIRLDAKQSNPDRYRAFLRCLRDEPVVIIGNRSVVYAPATNLGLIAIFDDGDPLHSEPLSPYVHSRDAALVRQEQQGCALIVLGHARSTEVERLVEVGWLHALAPQPSILPKVVPTAQQSSEDRLAAQARIPSTAWREARAALEFGPVLVQVARPGYAPRLACADCKRSARCMKCEGPLGQKTSRSTPACNWCGALAVDWKCANCEGERLRFVGSGAGRTAEDLGRAFPGVRIIVADGERPILTVTAEPALVIATRGAEPIAAGGYRAVLLLDGESMIARESLRVAEDCLRWWSNAAALAARRAPVVLVGVGGALASAFVTWRQAAFASAELADRRALRFPPAVRVATVTGTVQAVADAVATLGIDGPDILGPVDVEGGGVRTIVRFDYAKGAEIAATLRAEVVKSAANRRRALGKAARGPAPVSLKVRFDDVEPFLEQ